MHAGGQEGGISGSEWASMRVRRRHGGWQVHAVRRPWGTADAAHSVHVRCMAAPVRRWWSQARRSGRRSNRPTDFLAARWKPALSLINHSHWDQIVGDSLTTPTGIRSLANPCSPKPGGLRATQMCAIFPKRLNSSSRSRSSAPGARLPAREGNGPLSLGPSGLTSPRQVGPGKCARPDKCTKPHQCTLCLRGTFCCLLLVWLIPGSAPH
jgi:hypothetical protein